jgi:tripartite-type tricarboxylate transporter receptor subunit TctC
MREKENFMVRRSRSIFFIVGLLLLTVSVGSAATNPDLEFYKKKVVTIIVPTKAGGGYDAYARMAARFLGKYLPARAVIVKNVPGAGHIIGANEVYESAPDGLTFGMGNFKGLIFAQLAGLEGIIFDLRKYSWLGNAASEPQVMIMDKKTPYKTVKDLKESLRPVKMGASGVGSSSYNYALMASKVIGINVKMVPGLSGSETDMAMMRGEIDGQVGAYDNMRPMIDGEGARVVIVISKKKAPQFPNAAMISDFSTPANQGLVNLMVAMDELVRPIAAPPKIPAGRLKVLRDALDKTFKDPDLLAYSRKALLPITFASAEDTKTMFVNSLNQSPDVVKLVKELAQLQ